VLFVTVSLTCSARIQEDARSFMTGFFGVLKGNSFTLSTQCLGDNVENTLKSALSNWKNTSPQDLINIYKQLTGDFMNNCPVKEVEELVRAIELGLADGSIANNLKTNSQYIRDLLEGLAKSADVTPALAGETVGQLVKAVVYGQQPSYLRYRSLAQEESIEEYLEGLVAQYVEGLLEGLSSVPVEQNKCLLNKEKYTEDYVRYMTNLIKVILKLRNYNDANTEIYAIGNDLKVDEDNCHFQKFYQTLKSVTQSKEETVNVVVRIVMNAPELFKNFKEYYANLVRGEFKEAGIRKGNMIRIVYDFSTK